jgi:hypothetical protein
MLSKTDLAIADVEFPKRSQLIMGDRPNLILNRDRKFVALFNLLQFGKRYTFYYS